MSLLDETRLCVKQKEAARLLDVSVDHFVTLGIPSIPVGKTRRYRIRTLEEYLNGAERDLARKSK